MALHSADARGTKGDGDFMSDQIHPDMQPQEPAPLSFEEIEAKWHGMMNRISQMPMTPGMNMDKQMEVMQGCITEMLRTLKSHHPGKPLILPRGN